MRVKDVMTGDATICSPSVSLAEAAGLMWQHDCGAVPVINEADKVVGMITDRDICMAAAMTGRDLGHIAVDEVISRIVLTCKSDDEVQNALSTMQENQVRRLPVIDEEGKLEGILSLNDLVLKAEKPKDKKAPELSYAEVVDTFKAICQHRPRVEQARSATAS